MPSNFHNIEFIGWDGEGENDGKIDEWTTRQKYVLMMLSTGEYVYNEKGIGFDERLEFIREMGIKYPRAVHVIFGASYDFNKILEGLPLAILDELHHSKYWVQFGEYLLRYRPRKELTIAHLRGEYDPRIKARSQCDSYVRLWDVLGFFQTSFLETVKTWLGENYVDYDLIAQGKIERLNFGADSKEFMLRYTRAEVIALREIMKLVHTQLMRLELPITMWHGAGAIAAAAFKKYKLIDSFFEPARHGVKREKIQLPEEVNDACRYAFFGGRIESGYIGRYNGAIYNYDINSAYPHAASLLPNLNHGEWIKHNRIALSNVSKMGSMSIFRVRYYFHNERLYYPFPQRTLGGAVIFPREGERWIMYPELITAIETMPDYRDRIEIIEAWEFRQSPGAEYYNSFGIIAELYKERQRMVKEKDAAQIILKLALNSLYGKLCQKLGWNEKERTSPRFHFLLFGAWITSYVRAKIYAAIADKMDDVIAICTDGIISKTELSIEPDESKSLGKWSLEKADGIVQLQSGVYWINKGGIWKERARGLGRVTGDGITEKDREKNRNEKIAERIQQIENAWSDGRNKVYFPVSRFITSKQAARGGDEWLARWGHWYTMHDGDTVGRSLEIKCSGWGKRRLTKPIVLNQLTATEPSANVEYSGELGDLGEPYDLPWLSNDDEQDEHIDEEDLRAEVVA